MQPPSRRTFLALGLLLTGGTLTACTDSPHRDPGSPAGDHNRPDPDEPVRRRALDATDALLAAYDALLPQAPQLQPLREDVARHRAALDTATPAPTPSPGTGTSGTGAPGATPSSATTTAAVVPTTAALASLERQTAQARLADLGAASPPLARLLASVSAAGVLHAVALGDAAPAAAAAPAPSSSASPSASASTSASTSATASATASAAGPAAPFQDALGAEHAAVYGYGVVGARLTDDGQRTAARTSLAAHQARRDAWQRLLAGAGATPDPAAAGYQLPFPVGDAASAGRLAAHLETRLTTVYADLVAAVPTPQRPLAADALRESALRARQWGAAPTAFPGLADTPAATSTPTP
ncbi:ferritin-like domain-containing protein [Kitasatospora purpeofusca]|uniref:ferritin-like domain-containing protein n=1 Tax=Kitasatospora purpeofusca TaxID=67352 RepID=UPI00364891BA